MKLKFTAAIFAALTAFAATSANAATTQIAGGVTEITVIDSTLGLLVDNTDSIGVVGNTTLTGATFGFGISGGTAFMDGNALIEHDGVGVTLNAQGSSATIGDFIIDTTAGNVTGTLNGAGSFEFFVFGSGNDLPGVELLLSETLSSTLESFFSLPEDALEGATVGDAVPQPTLVPLPAAGWMLLAALGGLGLVRRRAATA